MTSGPYVFIQFFCVVFIRASFVLSHHRVWIWIFNGWKLSMLSRNEMAFKCEQKVRFFSQMKFFAYVSKSRSKHKTKRKTNWFIKFADFRTFCRKKVVRHLGAKFVIRIFLIIMFNHLFYIWSLAENRPIPWGKHEWRSAIVFFVGWKVVQCTLLLHRKNHTQNTICWLLAHTKVRWMTYLTCECYLQIICLMHVISTYRGTRKLNKEWEETSRKKRSRVREEKKPATTTKWQNNKRFRKINVRCVYMVHKIGRFVWMIRLYINNLKAYGLYFNFLLPLWSFYQQAELWFSLDSMYKLNETQTQFS